MQPRLSVLRFEFWPVLALVGLAAWLPLPAFAQSVNDQFEQYVLDICNTFPAPPGSNAAALSQLCTAAFAGGLAGGPAAFASSSNLGTANARSASANIAAALQGQTVRDHLEELKEEPKKGASAAGGGWGLLIAPQIGRSKRPETALENGYTSKLRGVVVGFDRRHSDTMVAGLAFGLTQDDADFVGDAGKLESTSATVTAYTTWAPTDAMYLDGYIGLGALRYKGERRIVFGSGIVGTASNRTSATQLMGGASAGYDWYAGKLTIGPYANADFARTKIDGYTESGGTLLELRYEGYTATSATAGLGVRASLTWNYDWGALVPSLRVAAIREYKNDSRQVNSALAISPGTPFLTATDEPDRNYLLAGLGLTAAMKGGSQLFIDFESRQRDTLLRAWSLSVGLLMEL